MIERIVAPLGLRVDATSPWVDARLPDGSRVQTRFLCALFAAHRSEVLANGDLRHHPVQPPAVWDALELVVAGVLERKAIPATRSFTVGRRAPRRGLRARPPGANRDAEARIRRPSRATSPVWSPARISIPNVWMASAIVLAHFDPAGGTVERDEEAVTHRLDLSSPVPGDLDRTIASCWPRMSCQRARRGKLPGPWSRRYPCT